MLRAARRRSWGKAPVLLLLLSSPNSCVSG
jgi:hypothetical protein